MYGAFSLLSTTMKKRRPKAEPLGISPFESRWKRRSPENAAVEVIHTTQESTTQVRPKRDGTGQAPPAYKVLTFKDMAVLHLALTRQYQRTVVDAVADEYEQLMDRLESILEERPEMIRFKATNGWGQ